MSTMVLDLFAGHGVGVALAMLGAREVAVEINEDAIATRALNYMSSPAYRDAWDIDKMDASGSISGIWASPPCQTFSNAGKGTGRDDIEQVLSMLDDGIYRSMLELKEKALNLGDERTGLVLTPFTYAVKFSPRFIVLEQVPGVLPIWERGAVELRNMGYSVWTGVIDAADHGIAQSRKRAYLIARNDGIPAAPPEAEERVTMFDVCGWGFTKRQSPTLTGHVAVTRSPTGTQKAYLNAIDAGEFVMRPGHSTKASTVAKSGIGAIYPPDAVNLTQRDALLLQSYPESFKLAGTKASWQLQVGNAVPPKLAEKILKTLI